MSGGEVHRTRRWRGVVAVSLAALGVGLVANRPDLLLAAVVGVAFAVYPRVSGPPTPALAIERELSVEHPTRGETVDVSVTLRNEGESTLFDTRIVDGVPPALTVAAGSPRRGAVLRPGEEVGFEYSVTAERGRHRFDPATVVVRDLSGEHEVETQVAAETEIDCTATGGTVPLRRQTLAAVGRVLADEGGSGVEFHCTREYRHGDAMSQIDWNRYARTGEPTTVEFRREQATRVAVVVDAREPAYRGREGEPHAVSYAVSAAGRVAEALLGRRNQVGVAGLGCELAWVAPGAGREHADDLQAVLATSPAFAAAPPRDAPPHGEQVAALRERLPDGTQVVLLSPLCDDDVAETATALNVHGHAVSVVSPRVTADGTTARRLAGVERRNRITELRNAEIPVVDWDPQRPLAAALTARGGR